MSTTPKGAVWKTSIVPRVSMMSEWMTDEVLGHDRHSVGEPKIAF